MRVFVAGSTGAVGKVIVPLLLQRGHSVTGLVHSAAKAKQLEALGAKAAVADAFDARRLTEAIEHARPEAIIHQLTSISGTSNFRKFDQEFAVTNRLRTEVTDTMLAAARAAGTQRFIAQSFSGWIYASEGGPIKTEEAP